MTKPPPPPPLSVTSTSKPEKKKRMNKQQRPTTNETETRIKKEKIIRANWINSFPFRSFNIFVGYVCVCVFVRARLFFLSELNLTFECPIAYGPLTPHRIYSTNSSLYLSDWFYRIVIFVHYISNLVYIPKWYLEIGLVRFSTRWFALYFWAFEIQFPLIGSNIVLNFKYFTNSIAFSIIKMNIYSKNCSFFYCDYGAHSIFSLIFVQIQSWNLNTVNELNNTFIWLSRHNVKKKLFQIHSKHISQPNTKKIVNMIVPSAMLMLMTWCRRANEHILLQYYFVLRWIERNNITHWTNDEKKKTKNGNKIQNEWLQTNLNDFFCSRAQIRTKIECHKIQIKTLYYTFSNPTLMREKSSKSGQKLKKKTWKKCGFRNELVDGGVKFQSIFGLLVCISWKIQFDEIYKCGNIVYSRT